MTLREVTAHPIGSRAPDLPSPLGDGEQVLRVYPVRAPVPWATGLILPDAVRRVLRILAADWGPDPRGAEPLAEEGRMVITTRRVVITTARHTVNVAHDDVTAVTWTSRAAGPVAPVVLRLAGRRRLEPPPVLTSADAVSRIGGFERYGFGDLTGHHVYCGLDPAVGADAAREVTALILAMRRGRRVARAGEGNPGVARGSAVWPVDLVPDEAPLAVYPLGPAGRLYLSDVRVVLSIPGRVDGTRDVVEVPLEEIEWVGCHAHPSGAGNRGVEFSLVHRGWHAMDLPGPEQQRLAPLAHLTAPLRNPTVVVHPNDAADVRQSLGALVATARSGGHWGDPLTALDGSPVQLAPGERLLARHEWQAPGAQRVRVLVTSRRVVAERVSAGTDSVWWDMPRVPEPVVARLVAVPGLAAVLSVTPPGRHSPEPELLRQARGGTPPWSLLPPMEDEMAPIVLPVAPDALPLAQALVRVLEEDDPVSAPAVPSADAVPEGPLRPPATGIPTRPPDGGSGAGEAAVAACDTQTGQLILTDRRLVWTQRGSDSRGAADEVWAVPLEAVHELIHYRRADGRSVVIPVVDTPVPALLASSGQVPMDATGRFPLATLMGPDAPAFASRLGAAVLARTAGLPPPAGQDWEGRTTRTPWPRPSPDEHMASAYEMGGGVWVWCTTRRLIVERHDAQGPTAVVEYPLEAIAAVEVREDHVPRWDHVGPSDGLTRCLCVLTPLEAIVGHVLGPVLRDHLAVRRVRTLILRTTGRGYDLGSVSRRWAGGEPVTHPVGAPRPPGRTPGLDRLADGIPVGAAVSDADLDTLLAHVARFRRWGAAGYRPDGAARSAVQSEALGVRLAEGEVFRGAWTAQARDVHASLLLSSLRLVATRQVRRRGWTNHVRWDVPLAEGLDIRAVDYVLPGPHAAVEHWPGLAVEHPVLPVATAKPAPFPLGPRGRGPVPPRPSNTIYCIEALPDDLHSPFQAVVLGGLVTWRRRRAVPLDPYYSSIVLPWPEDPEAVAAESGQRLAAELAGQGDAG